MTAVMGSEHSSDSGLLTELGTFGIMLFKDIKKRETKPNEFYKSKDLVGNGTTNYYNYYQKLMKYVLRRLILLLFTNLQLFLINNGQ